jgi:hypothetical protein
VLRAGFEKQLNTDSGQAVGKRIRADDFGEIFAVGRTGILRIRHDEKQAHTDFVAGFTGLKVDAGARDADAAAHVVKVPALRIGRANAHELCDFAAAAGTTLGVSAPGKSGILRRFIHGTLKGPILCWHRRWWLGRAGSHGLQG